MSDAKHTPGPWVIKPEEVGKDYIRIRGDVPGLRYKICNVITPVYAGVHDREMQETRANARLIAAAPELLAALEDMLGGWRYIRQAHGDLYGVGWDRAQELAEKAIAKAKGES